MSSSIITEQSRVAQTRSVSASAGLTYRHYVLALLVMVGVLAWMDRNVLSVLLESIKKEMAFNDTELGLLGGVAFGLMYTVAGIPIALLADRRNRRNVIAGALVVWSAMTAVCGLATNFSTLFLARMGVGLGEAGSTPASQSIVSDYFPPESRGFAFGVLSLYIPLGFLIGFLSGGWLNEAFGWRAAFAIVGIPGLLVAALARVTLREPMRGTYDQVFDNDRNPSILSSIKHFLSIPSLRHLPAASAIYGVGAFAVAVWMSSYLIRSFGMSSGEAGTWMALAYGGGGGVGIVTGGYLADLLARRTRDKRWYAWLSAITLVCVAPVAAVTFLTTDRTIAVWSLVLGTALSHMFIGPLVASLQSLAGVRRRAIIAASYLLIQNLVSMGIGPLAVGLVSDYFASRVGGASLKVALLAIVPLSAAWASLHFLLASRTLNEDLDNAARTDAANLATKPELVPAPRQVWDNAEGLVR